MSSSLSKKRHFQRMLVPYDFSPSAAAALATAVDLAVAYDGALLVMHAIPCFFPLHGRPVPPSATDLAATGKKLAECVAAAVKGRRVRRVRSWVTAGTPAECILEASSQSDAIVMGTLGRTGLPHLLLGSVAERVVRFAAVPVLTVRASARKA